MSHYAVVHHAHTLIACRLVTTVTFIYNENCSNAGFTMLAKLKVIEVRTDKTVELPEKIIPVKLEPIMEPCGLIVPVISDKFLLHYFEKESSK